MKVNSQLERAQLENVTSLPTAATAGRVMWNTTDGKFYLDDAALWRAVLRNDGKLLIGNSATVSDNVRIHRGGVGILQFVAGSDVTAEGTLATTIAQIGFRTTNYSTGTLPANGNVGRFAFDTTTVTPKFDTGSVWKELVDTSTTQTISGKTLTTPIFGTTGVFTQIATPSAPSAGFTSLYSKTDGKLYYMGSDTVEHPVGAGGGGGINYITNPDSESGVVGWNAYKDAAGTKPVDGTGGSPTLSISRSTSSPLRGTASFLVSHTAANLQGEGVSTDFTIDAADKAKQMTISFDYEFVGGAPATGDFAVYIYDVTNSKVIQPSSFQITNVVGPATKTSATFQTNSNSVSYRLCIHCASTTSSSFTLKLDNISVGPVDRSTGVPVTDWVPYTPTFTAFGSPTNVSFYSRRVGDSLEVKGTFTTGSTTAATAFITVGYNGVNGNVVSSSTKVNSGNGITGIAASSNTGGFSYYTFMGPSSSSMTMGVSASGLGGFSSANGSTIAGPGENLTVSMMVPIEGWSSNVVMSDSANTRLVAWHGYSNSTATVNGFVQLVSWATLKDTHNAFDISASSYTVSTPGEYRISGQIQYSTAGGTYLVIPVIYKNGAQLAYGQRAVTSTSFPIGPIFSNTHSFLAGDVITIYAYASSSVSLLGSSGGIDQQWSIEMLSGPATIAASDLVGALYNGVATGTLGGAYNLATFPTKQTDTHGSYASGSYTIFAPGLYNIAASVGLAGTATTSGYEVIAIYKNGAALFTAPRGYAGTLDRALSISVNAVSLIAGDQIAVYVYTDSSSPVYGTTIPTAHFFSICRLSGLR